MLADSAVVYHTQASPVEGDFAPTGKRRRSSRNKIGILQLRGLDLQPTKEEITLLSTGACL